MSAFSQWKTIAYAVAIFVAGGISGGALTVYEVKQNLFAPPREQELALRLRTRLQTKLALTPEQVAQVNPIIDKAAAQLRSIRLDTIQQVNKVFEDTYAQISAILTPDQRAKLAIMQKERLAMMELHRQENHHHPGDADHGGPGGSPQ
jgi:Spy/CpxP family protein refolding chaperone